MRVLIMAGGTGGHVFPALAVAEVLGQRGAEVHWLGAEGGREVRWVGQAGLPIHTVPVAGLRGKSLGARLKGVLSMMRALMRALGIVRRLKPDVVLGMGGYAAAPGALASRVLRCPLVIHEQNALPGMTNRVLARFATQCLEAFPGAMSRIAGHVELVGNPVRRTLIERSAEAAAAGSRTPLTILVLGGSLGAQALNEIVPRSLAEISVPVDMKVIHQAGEGKAGDCLEAYRKAGVEADVVPFIDDMGAAYAQADLVICRAGAMTLAELMVMGRPAILVPFPHAVDDHQYYNARYLADAGAACILRQSELTPARLGKTVQDLLSRPERLQEMGQSARSLARPEAAERIADILETLAHA